ncbi:ornithine carbamoyltransferase, partial [Alkalihalophilus pseudofirmus]|nr:ornithine carbamoyltransferase [Alkalihalophilus pseudofirmus]
NNMAHSLLEGAVKVGMDISIASPPGYLPNEMVTEKAIVAGKQTGATVTVTNNPVEAIKAADVVVTDVWTSMGQEEETSLRLQALSNYQVNEELCKHAK